MLRPVTTILLAGLFVSAGTAAAQQRWTLVEDLRIGTIDEGPDSFNDLRGLAVARDGSILVLDFRTQDIRVFDRNGRHVKNVGGRGAGPGEMRNANGMAMAGDSAIWVNDPSNQRFSVFAPDGRFLRQHQIPIRSYGFIWEATVDAQGQLLVPIAVREPGAQSSQRMLERIWLEGRVRDTIAWPSCSPRTRVAQGTFSGRGRGGNTFMAIPFAPRASVAINRHGRAWCTPSDEYRVLLLDLQTRDTLRVIEANIPGPPVSAAERAEQIERIRKTLAEYEHVDADYSLIPRTKPPIAILHLDDRDRLWVRRTPVEPAVTIFDVWTDGGQHIATVRAPFRLDTFRPVVIRGDYFYGITLDEDDVQYVVRARIAR